MGVSRKDPRTFSTWLVVLMLTLATGASLSAQSTTDGAISGTVSDSSGVVVADAAVTVTSNTTALQFAAATDD